MAAYSFAEDSGKLVFELKNSRPIELSDLTKSLNAVANQYRRYVIRENLHEESEAKLYVKEVRDGSTIVELFSYAQAHHGVTASAIVTSAAVVGFGAYLKETYSEIREGKKPADLTNKDLNDLKTVLEPTAKDPGGQVLIHADHGHTVQVSIDLKSSDANIIQNQATRIIEEIQETNQHKYTKRPFYWDVASKGEPRSSDKGIIESIEPKPLHVIFEDNSIKERMVGGKHHPFNTTYIVDVELMTVRGKSKFYRITKLHEVIEDEDEV